MSALPISFRRKLQPGRGARITQRGNEVTLDLSPGTKWRHPWQTTPIWSSQAKQWMATIEPGFVNSYGTANTSSTPSWRATVAEQKAAGNPWENNPLTGKPFFSAPVFNQSSASVAATTDLDLPLYLSPFIPLDLYGIGFDGDPAHGVPDFFLNLGAAVAPPQVPTSDLVDGIQPASPTPPKGLRLLRACDLWVHQPRLALTSEILLEPGIATGLSNVTQTLGVSFPVGDTLRILNGQFTPLTSFTAGIDPLQGDYTEPAFDEILISTVYLLSPPNAPIGSVPDGTWMPYVRHNLFWNLNWAQPFFSQLPGDPGTPFIPPLAGGAAQLVINFLTASLNDATRQALNLLIAHSMAGFFWTPTGGGTDATFEALATAQAAPNLGPDKAKNAAAKLAAMQAQARATQLDPNFPYRGTPFPLSLLSK